MTTSGSLAEVLRTVVVHGVVPCLLVAGAITGWIAASLVSGPSTRAAAYAGSCAGLVAVAAYALLAVRGAITLRVPPTVGVLGLGLGLVTPALFWLLRRNRALGVVCLVQVFGSLASLVDLYLVPGLHGLTIWLALCDAFGTCVFFLLPSRLTDRVVARSLRRTTPRAHPRPEDGPR